MRGPRLERFDLLRAAAILGVVAIHATSPALAAIAAGRPPGGGRSALFWLLAAVNQLGRFSVPAFFLMAGFFTSFEAGDRFVGQERIGRYVRRRLGRVLVPYLTWSLVFFVLPRWARHDAPLPEVARALLLGTTFTGGYFLIVLAQFSVLGPFLARTVAARRPAAWAACLVLLGTTAAWYGAGAYGRGPASGVVRDAFSASLSLFYVWASFFLTGLLTGAEPEQFLSALRGRRRLWAAFSLAFFAGSLWEFRIVLDRTGSLGLAASFLKPTSSAFALAFCAWLLSGPDRTGPATAPWRPLADASYATYLVHGGIILALLGIGSPPWRALLGTAAGPLVLGVVATAAPLALHRVVERYAPAPIRFILFG